MGKRVVITGMSLASPLGSSVDTAFERLKTYQNCVRYWKELDRFKKLNTRLVATVDGFKQPEHFDRKVLRTMGPLSVMAVATAEEALKDAGIPLIPHLGYKEMTPLGQAEWIKFVGMLIGQEELAEQTFDGIATKYNNLKQMVANIDKRPTVFSGEIHGGNWYAVGGRSFLAQLIEDAGADYFLKEDEHSGGINLDFETVYSQAEDADYWRIVNSFQGTFSYNALKEEDARYADFKAFKEKKVIYCNMRTTPFYEGMPVEPELVLSDLIKIFYPDLLPDYEPHYYELLP